MTQQLFEITLSATGEVRDADGNLLNQVPVTQTIVVTEDELAAMEAAAAEEGELK